MKTCPRGICLQDPALCENAVCQGLPTQPIPEIGTVLVTGASGYVGGRLIVELLERGYRVRAMVRRVSRIHHARWPGAEVVEADAFRPDTLRVALKGVHTAYYLIHSMLLGPASFSHSDLNAAQNFAQAAAETGVKRIIYLGGLGDRGTALSEHLRNRMEVGEILRSGSVPTTVLRAAIVLGSGSASYEIMHHLVATMPVIPMPSWGRNRCQPISVRDVMKYLIGTLEVPEAAGRQFDIGGDEILSYCKMLRQLAALLQRKVVFVPSPVSDPSLYGYLLSLITPVPAPIVSCLMASLQNEVVCQETEIKRHLPFKTMPFTEAVRAARVREELDRVTTRWSDAYPRGHDLATHLDELPQAPRFIASHSLVTRKSPGALYRSFCRVGGRYGWFENNWMWRLRGRIDRILLGVGHSRGRKNQGFVELGEVIDFWRVEDVRENERLLLRAEMRLPGKAWLEFKIVPAAEGVGLVVTAFFEPGGTAGSLYWYSLLPFHKVIFDDLLAEIERRA